MPAMNRLLTDWPDAIAYIMNGMLGGIITPIPPATATIAVLNLRSYPRAVSTGMVMLPTAATVAGPDPDIAPKNMQVATTEQGIPAGNLPNSSENTSNIFSEMPPLAIIMPESTNMGTAMSGKLSIPPTMERITNCPLAVKEGSNAPGSTDAIPRDIETGIARSIDIMNIIIMTRDDINFLLCSWQSLYSFLWSSILQSTSELCV